MSDGWGPNVPTRPGTWGDFFKYARQFGADIEVYRNFPVGHGGQLKDVLCMWRSEGTEFHSIILPDDATPDRHMDAWMTLHASSRLGIPPPAPPPPDLPGE